MFVNALCVSMGVLLIITLKTTIHQKHKRLLPKGNNKRQGRVCKERKGRRSVSWAPLLRNTAEVGGE